MKKILVINLGWEQEPLLDALMEYDVEIYGIHSDTNYYKVPNYKDVLIADFRDLEKIIGYANTIKLDAVISDECDYSYFAQAVVAETLNLPGPRIKEAQIATNKYLQRVKAQEKGLLIPSFKLCTSLEEVYQFAKENSYPIIAKPVDNRGSFGVNKINNKGEAKQAFYDALENSHSRLVLVEKFIEGTHITVDGYIFHESGAQSLTIAEKTLTQGSRQVALDIKYPANFSEILYSRIIQTNQIVNTLLGFEFGMTHSEYMITNDEEICLIETANRGGGVYTSEIIVPAASGIDILNQYICDALKIKKTFFEHKVQRNQVNLQFFSLMPGKIEDIKGIEKLNGLPNILKADLFVKKGEKILNITSDANRHGFIISKGEVLNMDHITNTLLEITYEK